VADGILNYTGFIRTHPLSIKLQWGRRPIEVGDGLRPPQLCPGKRETVLLRVPREAPSASTHQLSSNPEPQAGSKRSAPGSSNRSVKTQRLSGRVRVPGGHSGRGPAASRSPSSCRGPTGEQAGTKDGRHRSCTATAPREDCREVELCFALLF